MTVDLGKATDFLATHGRVLDRRRFELRDGGDPAAVLAALDGYGNPDGGYGWGLEPDLRSPESQPGGALHALEVLKEAPDAGRTRRLLDWLGSIARPDGGLPFALPTSRPAGTAWWWAQADPAVSSLQITAAVAAAAHQVPDAAGHPWLPRATDYCVRRIDALEGTPPAMVLSFALGLLDAIGDAGRIRRLGAYVPADRPMPVEGGTADEVLHPLDLAPRPGRPVRELFEPALIDKELDRVAAGQRADGGWTVEFAQFSPAGAMDWRGYVTVAAIDTLRAHGRL